MACATSGAITPSSILDTVMTLGLSEDVWVKRGEFTGREGLSVPFGGGVALCE